MPRECSGVPRPFSDAGRGTPRPSLIFQVPRSPIGCGRAPSALPCDHRVSSHHTGDALALLACSHNQPAVRSATSTRGGCDASHAPTGRSRPAHPPAPPSTARRCGRCHPGPVQRRRTRGRWSPSVAGPARPVRGCRRPEGPDAPTPTAPRRTAARRPAQRGCSGPACAPACPPHAACRPATTQGARGRRRHDGSARQSLRRARPAQAGHRGLGSRLLEPPRQRVGHHRHPVRSALPGCAADVRLSQR